MIEREPRIETSSRFFRLGFGTMTRYTQLSSIQFPQLDRIPDTAFSVFVPVPGEQSPTLKETGLWVQITGNYLVLGPFA